MSDAIWIRDLNQRSDSDIHSALAIFRQAFEDCWDERFLRNVLKKGHHAYLAGSGDLACGCLLYRFFREERDILGVGVLRDATRLGYGTALVRTLQTRMLAAKARCNVTTYIPPDNEIAQHTFLKLGFQWVWTEPNYAGQGPLRIYRWIPSWPEESEETAVESKRT